MPEIGLEFATESKCARTTCWKDAQVRLNTFMLEPFERSSLSIPIATLNHSLIGAVTSSCKQAVSDWRWINKS